MESQHVQLSEIPMFFVFVFFVIVVIAEFFSGLILDLFEQKKDANKKPENEKEKAKREPLSTRLGAAIGISFLTMLIAFFLQGPDGIFEMNVGAALPFLAMAAVIGAMLNAMPIPFISNGSSHSLKEIDYGEVVRTAVIGAMLRKLLMGLLAVLFLFGVVVVALVLKAN